MNDWTWEAASPLERGKWIRWHRYQCKNHEQIRALFCLTAEGIGMIMRGDIWRPEYETSEAA